MWLQTLAVCVYPGVAENHLAENLWRCRLRSLGLGSRPQDIVVFVCSWRDGVYVPRWSVCGPWCIMSCAWSPDQLMITKSKKGLHWHHGWPHVHDVYACSYVWVPVWGFDYVRCWLNVLKVVSRPNWFVRLPSPLTHKLSQMIFMRMVGSDWNDSQIMEDVLAHLAPSLIICYYLMQHTMAQCLLFVRQQTNKWSE